MLTLFKISSTSSCMQVYEQIFYTCVYVHYIYFINKNMENNIYFIKELQIFLNWV